MSPDRRPIVAVGVAVLVVAAITAVILLLGYIPLPSFPALAADPDPSIPGTVAFVRRTDAGACVMTVPASGAEPRQVTCRGERTFLEGPGSVAWTPDGRLLIHEYEEFGGPVVTIIDPDTGTELDRIPFGEPPRPDLFFDAERLRAERPDGTRILVGRSDTVSLAIRTPDGETRTLLEVEEAPRNYALFGAQWSPDGEWVLVEDSEQRLILLAADGDPAPRILAADATGAAWYVPGNPTYTIDPADLEE